MLHVVCCLIMKGILMVASNMVFISQARYSEVEKKIKSPETMVLTNDVHLLVIGQASPVLGL